MHLFFDLDGTLTDPFDGITGSIIHALDTLGIAAPHPAQLGWTIGPPLIESFAQLGVPDPDRALALYRQRYAVAGLFENRLYPGTIECLETLRSAGHRLYLMTAKAHVFARKITAHFGVAPFLEAEYGPELDDEAHDKATLLGRALSETGIDPDNALMIGDRRYDHIAARKNGLTSIAALWGYGTDEEHALADHRCADLSDLPGLIARITDQSGKRPNQLA